MSDGTATGRGVALRVFLTALGATALIIGAFQKWADHATGQRIHLKALVKQIDPGRANPARFLHSAGFVMVVLGLVALAGLAFRSGWVTRAAGAAGAIVAALFLVQLCRTNGHPAVGPGAWVCLGGSLVAVAASFVGTGRVAGTGPDGPPASG